MKKITIALFVTLLLYTDTTFAQANGSDEVQSVEALILEIIRAPMETRHVSIEKFEQGIATGKLSATPKIKAMIILLKGLDVYNMDKTEEASKVANDLFKKADEVENALSDFTTVYLDYRAYGYLLKGLVTYRSANYDEKYFLKYLDSADMQKPTFYVGMYRGSLLEYAKNYDAALEQYEKAVKCEIGSSNDAFAFTVHEADVYASMAEIYSKKNMNQKAIDYYLKAYETFGLCKYYFFMAYSMLSSPDATYQSDAIGHFWYIFDALSKNENIPPFDCQNVSDLNLSYAASSLGDYYRNEKKYQSAAFFYGKAFDYAPDSRSGALAAENYLAIGNNDWALDYANWCLEVSKKEENVEPVFLGMAYLVKGYIKLAAGQMAEAKSDLQAAQKYGNAQATQYLSKYF